MQKNEIITIDIKKFIKKPKYMRDLGADLREMIKITWDKSDIVQLDFDGETIASGSLFDEIAKLFDEFPKEEVKRRLKFVNIDPWDEKLIAHLAKLRLDKQKRVTTP